MTTRTRIPVLMLCIASLCLPGIAGPLPAQLPKPDGKPATDSKPVKVYILAGQSNMVGFGKLGGSTPVYPSIFLSADPNIKVGRMPVGSSALLRHGVYQGAADDAATGALAMIYQGAYQEGFDAGTTKPAKQEAFPLGTVSANVPGISGPHTVVAKAFIDVPLSGNFEVHAGYESSTHALVKLDGKEVYRKDPGGEALVTAVALEAGKRYPIQITYMQGGSAALWLKQVDLKGQGDLTTLTKDGKYTWFVDDEGKWTVRNDVTYWDVRTSKEEIGSGGPLSATSNGKFIGSEVPFGFVMGAFHDAHVLLIESSMGNRALSFDFRPPSSGKTEAEKENKFCGLEYDMMVEGAHKALKNIDKIVPGYKGQGYEIVGFVWWQGHKDKGQTQQQYEDHLVNLIQDLRAEFKAPEMRAVVASVGFEGDKMAEDGYLPILRAQMAVGDPKQHPEFSGTVASVDTRPFWRSRAESPTGVGYHYNHNAETYVLTGDALGRAMVELLGGTAERITLPPKQALHPDVETIFSDAVTGAFNKRGPHYSPEYYREMGQALKPIIMEEMVPAFLASPKSGPAIRALASAQRPKKLPLDIRGPLDSLMEYYDIAGVSDYSWKPFGPDTRKATWSYYSFDPPEKLPPEKSNRYREITFPEGMENWYTADFDAAAAGWKQGPAPFGRMGDKLDRRRPSCNGSHCGCSEMPATLWEKEVLLMRQTFDMPAVKEGHVYRLILGGAGCDRSGEGFAVYVNGKLLTQANGGFYRNTGIRGGYLYTDILPEFDGSKVTIAVINFLRYTHFSGKTTYFGPYQEYYGKTVPPNGHVTLWLEEAKLPPLALQTAMD